MNDDVLPPMRNTHLWQGPAGPWSYDLWGSHGRPLVLIHAVLFDKAMWWPAAADLRTHATVVALDLPGHGSSPGRSSYDQEVIVDELAQLVHTLGVAKAPVVVGHGSSARIAELFAAQYATHAVITVDDEQPDPATDEYPDALPDVDRYLADMRVDAVTPAYRHLVNPVADAALLAAYMARRHRDQPSGASRRLAVHPRRLAIRSRPPSAGESLATAAADGWLRREFYGVRGCFAHLTNLRRFVQDVRSLL